ncbi:MAG: hypothetical protein JJ884_08170 [Maricaulis sp.]|uniref:hypothetical protein n=1 Tax=Maricaulis sp. TaxID=1486257 RepID=UPI001B2E67EF|nr:hypothetical protein [Maricaulis sp.]MBO6729556.1 hypothetical protein [Maricaulis sp.]MBO6847483.1 hypothetical protein [Maricaulis sp.]MBO6877053.1 hypothetical protein [Maricaulis sp.]
MPSETLIAGRVEQLGLWLLTLFPLAFATLRVSRLGLAPTISWLAAGSVGLTLLAFTGFGWALIAAGMTFFALAGYLCHWLMQRGETFIRASALTLLSVWLFPFLLRRLPT